MRAGLLVVASAAVLLLGACGGGDGAGGGEAVPDAGRFDGDLGPDAGRSELDAEALPDAGESALDAGTDAAIRPDASLGADAGGALDAGDAGGIADPIGMISGSCGVLDTELTDASPHWIENTTFFPDGWTIAEAGALSAGAQTILTEGTAGGSSGYSEAFAFEVLHRCEGASLIKTETHIVYSVPMPGSITDILVDIMGERIGVSVTRAVTVTGMCMRADTFTATQATDLLTRKLSGINESSMLVAAEDRWTKQILFVFADTAAHAAALMTAWSTLDATLRADTILYVSVSEEMDSFIYFEDRCP